VARAERDADRTAAERAVNEADHRSNDLAALASATRRRILKLLSRGEHTIADIADLTGLHRATVRHHVQTLLRTDLIREARQEGKRAGRPATVYAAKAGSGLTGYPPRQYQMLSEIAIEALVRAVGKDEANRILEETSREWGVQLVQHLAATHGVESWTPEAFARTFVLGAVPRMGLDVELLSRDERRVRYRMFSCPFQEVALKNTELVCEHLDRGFYAGVVQGLGEGAATRRLACIGHGDPYCEYEFRWARSIEVETSPTRPSVREGPKRG